MAADLDLLTPALVSSAAILDASPAFLSNTQDPSEHSGGDLPLEILREFPTKADNTSSGLVTGAVSAALASLTSIPVLNSLAGAAASLYLDFNGHFEPVWGGYRNITTPVFDQDGDASSFSEGELTTMRNIWAVVAEDFAPLNINVTTVEPTSFANGVAVRAAIGGNSAWLGGGAGGVAYVDSFTNSIVNTVYVFENELANGYWRYVGEATSHEAGHSFGLHHQALFSSTGSLLKAYNPGNSAVAPIMGNSYTATRGTWSAGRDSDGDYQDDLAILSRPANGFGHRADDHGNTAGSATALSVSGSTASGSGIITTVADVDYFSFDTDAGQVTFSVAVPVGINNLDTRIELRDAVGTLIASAAPATSFGATLTATLAAGSYRLVVGSQGNYGDIGQYTISGTIVPATVVTVNAPSGLTATSGGTSVSLSWTDNATNESGVVVERRAGSGTWTQIATLAANTTSYVDSTVVAGETYDYRVYAAREFVASSLSDEVTMMLAPASPTGLAAVASSGTRVDLTWTNVVGESGYKVERLAPGGNWTQLGTTGADVASYADATATAGVTYQYRVRATNAGGDSAYCNVASVTTPIVLTRPTAPSGLAAFNNANRQVQLSWRDNSTNEKLFLVQRSSNGYSWTTLGSVRANSTIAIDATALRGRTYYYRVFAYNDAGYSTASNSARVVTPYFAPSTSRATTAIRTTPVIPPLSAATPRPGARSLGVATPIAAPASPSRASTAGANPVASTPFDWVASVDAVFAELTAASHR